jgi:transposase
MDDNARLHRSRAVTAYLQSESVTCVPWPAMRPDLNPTEHIWNILGRRMHDREPPVQNIRQLEALYDLKSYNLLTSKRRPDGFVDI